MTESEQELTYEKYGPSLSSSSSSRLTCERCVAAELWSWLIFIETHSATSLLGCREVLSILMEDEAIFTV